MGSELSADLNSDHDSVLHDSMGIKPRPRCRYKLTSLESECKGRAEPIRLLFRIVGVPFQDCRITAEHWLSIKQTTPYGCLPVLELDSGQFGESGAILRWAARKFGLSGQTDSEQLDVEAALTQTLGVFNDVIDWTNDDRDPNSNVKHPKESVTQLLTQWEQRATEITVRGHTFCFLAGTSVTVADILMFCLLDEISSHKKSEEFQLNQFPKLLALRSTVASLPQGQAKFRPDKS